MDANQQRQTSSGAKPLSPTRLGTVYFGLPCGVTLLVDTQSPCVLVVGRRLRALSVNALLEGSLVHDPLQIHFSPTRLETDYMLGFNGVTIDYRVLTQLHKACGF
jgi:hypothetical protein